jgi:hypothetical protein
MVYETGEEVVQADLAGVRLMLCRRLPWLDNPYGPVARLRLYLPAALMRGHGARSDFALDALFIDRADALRYQATTSLRLWSLPNGSA